MRRTLVLALALAVAGCGGPREERPRPDAEAAGPQRAQLDWRERYPAAGSERLVFAVESFAVTTGGWTARVAVTNETSVPFLARPAAGESRYGVMLFATGELAELEEAAGAGRLPPVRGATGIEPSPPRVLAPGATWRARLAGRGSLAAGSHARVVFGPFRAQEDPPEGMEPVVVWITDRSYRLRR